MDKIKNFKNNNCPLHFFVSGYVGKNKIQKMPVFYFVSDWMDKNKNFKRVLPQYKWSKAQERLIY